MPSFRSSRKVAAFFGEESARRTVGALALQSTSLMQNRLLLRKGRLPHSEVWVEKRVVASDNSDCCPYSLEEFKKFFGPDHYQLYWDSAVRLPSSTAMAHSLFGDASEADEAMELPAPPRTARRLSPRIALRQSVIVKVLAMRRAGFPDEFICAVLSC